MANEIKTVDDLRGAYPALVNEIEEAAAQDVYKRQGVGYQTLRNWKAADKWDEALPKRKRGGQPGNRNKMCIRDRLGPGGLDRVGVALGVSGQPHHRRGGLCALDGGGDACQIGKAGGNQFGGGFGSVSYTHLDVYKRQR